MYDHRYREGRGRVGVDRIDAASAIAEPDVHNPHVMAGRPADE